MLPKMRTRSAGRPVAESLKGGMGEQVGNHRNVGNQNGNVVNENVQENVRNVLANENRNYAMVEAGHAAYTNKFHELDKLVPYLVTPESRKIESYMYGLAPQIRGMVATTEPKTTQKALQILGALTDEAIRNRSINKVEKKGNIGKPSKDKNGRDDNKRTRTGNAFATIANPAGRENIGAWPKCTTCNFFHAPEGSCHTCFNCNRPGHLARDSRVVLRNVNPVNVRNPTPARGACHECGSSDHFRPTCPRLNRTQGLRGNRPNQVTANNGGEIHRKQENQARGMAFMLGAEEARQDSNIVTGIEPSELGFRYEIEIASGQLVEIDKVIKGMGWLSKHKAKIICHEKVVRIPLLDGKVLRVLGEKPKEKVRLLMSTKTRDKKQEKIIVVRDSTKVFPDDLSGLPPLKKIEFQIELIPRAVPVAKSPYRLAPFELEEFIENFSKIAKSLTILTQKCKTFDWGEEQEFVFQTLKDKLCNTPVLALPDGPKDFVRRWIELFSVYDCEISYHLGKANVVADSLSRKERVNPKRVRAMNMTLQSSIKDKILAAQKEVVDESVGLQSGLDKMIEKRSDGTLYYLDRIWVPLEGDVRTLIMDEAHKSKYSVHPEADKMYYDLRDRHDIMWVIMDRLTKSAHLLTMREDYKIDILARFYLNEIVARHSVLISIISDRDSRFTSGFWQSMQEALGTRSDMSMAYHLRTDGQSERTIQTLKDMLRACVLDFKGSWDVHLPLIEFSYNNSYHSSVRCASFELVEETTEKISQIKDRLKVARDRVVRFGKKGKLGPRYVGPFEIIEKVGPVAYMLDLPEELDGAHDTFYVSNLKKCLADPTLQVPLDEIQVDAKLNFLKEHVEILEREFKKLKRSRISIVKFIQILYLVDGGDFAENCGNLWFIVNNSPF
nr:hypothetical protein [Tanacetum cinerariifolium]